MILIAPSARLGKDDFRGEGALVGACARARSVKCGECAVRCAQEAMGDGVRVNVESRGRSHQVDAVGEGALPGARTRTLSVKRREDGAGKRRAPVIQGGRASLWSAV